jgi:hypothetical protein
MKWRTARKPILAIGVGCALTLLVTAGCKTAGGAAVGAGIGAIAGDAGMGAAIGAGVGFIGDIID